MSHHGHKREREWLLRVAVACLVFAFFVLVVLCNGCDDGTSQRVQVEVELVPPASTNNFHQPVIPAQPSQ